jgi:hypothetical protein
LAIEENAQFEGMSRRQKGNGGADLAASAERPITNANSPSVLADANAE